MRHHRLLVVILGALFGVARGGPTTPLFNLEDVDRNFDHLNVGILDTGIILHQGFADKVGLLWSKQTIHSTDPLELDIEVEFSVRGSDVTGTDGFAVWITPETMPSAVPPEFDLFGWRNQFSGFGVFFALNDRAGKLRPSISALFNDGTVVVNQEEGTPSNDGVYYAIRNSAESLIFKLTVRPDAITGLVRVRNTTTWTQTFKMTNVPTGFAKMFPAHVGVSASSRKARDGESIRIGDEIVLTRFEVSAKAPTDPQPTVNSEPRIKNPAAIPPLLPAQAHVTPPAIDWKVLDQKIQEAIAAPLAEFERVIENQLQKSVEEVQKVLLKLGRMEKTITQYQDHHDQPKNKEILTDLQQSVAGLQKNVQAVQRRVDRQKEPMNNAPEIRSLQASFEQAIKSQSSMSWWMIGSLAISVLALTLFIWRQVTVLQKKHLL